MTLKTKLINTIQLLENVKQACIIKDNLHDAADCNSKRDVLIDLLNTLPDSLLNQEIPKE
jgi:hypothetical protein